MESGGPALPGVSEEERGRFSSKFKTSTQLKSRTSYIVIDKIDLLVNVKHFGGIYTPY